MATTKIWSVKNRLDHVLEYVSNEDKPHETNADTVHEIGVETATRLYGDRYQFVVCTHLDKDHLHNHIVLNPISIVDGKRYHNSMKDIYKLRKE